MPQVIAEKAWLVTVDLDVVASHLRQTYDHHFSRLSAQAWLTSARSPFAETKTFGTLYCETEPANLLNDGEIIRVIECPPRMRPLENQNRYNSPHQEAEKQQTLKP